MSDRRLPDTFETCETDQKLTDTRNRYAPENSSSLAAFVGQIEERRAAECEVWMHYVSGAEWIWYVKRLAGNDTLLTGGHQGGPYMPNRFTRALFPSIATQPGVSATRSLEALLDSHGDKRSVAVKYWMTTSKTETHLTGWGGGTSAMLAPESTGSIAVFAFRRDETGEPSGLAAWLCSSVAEEDQVEHRIGPVEPAIPRLVSPAGVETNLDESQPTRCSISAAELRPEWLGAFPSTVEILRLSVERTSGARSLRIDDRLLLRRGCEFELFRSLEKHIYLERIQEGFQTVDLFIDYANSVANRRRSRSGSSLGLQTKYILEEEEILFSYDQISEGRKRPDFLFPSADAYANSSFPADRLTMLAAKTTAKDRWRQILNEADRLPLKHLLTLQEGVTETQFAEMRTAGVVLVVPRRLHRRYPKAVQPHLLTLEDFIRSTAARSR